MVTGIAQKKLQSFISIVVPQEKRYTEIDTLKITQRKDLKALERILKNLQNLFLHVQL